jgi:hypothetical protein
MKKIYAIMNSFYNILNGIASAFKNSLGIFLTFAFRFIFSQPPVISLSSSFHYSKKYFLKDVTRLTLVAIITTFGVNKTYSQNPGDGANFSIRGDFR